MTASALLELALAGTISPEEFDHKLQGLEVGLKPRLRTYQQGDATIFRARDLPQFSRPSSSAELSYPPRKMTRPGRANAEGEQVFYATSRFAPSFMECGLKAGEYVVCSRWNNVAPLTVRELGLHLDGGSGDLNRLYHELFTSSHPSIYAYSAQMARRMMSGETISGLVYPSRTANGNGENIALKPNAVCKALRAIDASLYRVKKSDNHAHVLEEIDYARAAENGALRWLGKPARNNGELRVVTEGGEYRAYDGEGNLLQAA